MTSPGSVHSCVEWRTPLSCGGLEREAMGEPGEAVEALCLQECGEARVHGLILSTLFICIGYFNQTSSFELQQGGGYS